MYAVSSPVLAKQPDLTKFGGVPATPTRPIVTPLSHDSVAIAWTDSADPTIAGCQVLRRNLAIHARRGFEVVEASTASSVSSYTDTCVAPDPPIPLDQAVCKRKLSQTERR